MAPKAPRGRFVWYELLSARQEAPVGFYTKLFGWGTEKWQGPGDMPPYTMWTLDGRPIGGTMPLPDEAKQAGAPPHWMLYVSTPDTDASLEQAKRLGAKPLMGPMDIPEMGRFAVLADPQGAVFALYTPADAAANAGPPAPAAPGMVSWHELMTTDWQKAFDFYAKLFGWEKHQAHDMGPLGTYQVYKNDAPWPVGGMFNKPAEVPVPAWLVYFRVTDLDGTLKKVRASGGKVLNGPEDVPGGDRVAQCLDPEGAAFAVHWRAPGA